MIKGKKLLVMGGSQISREIVMEAEKLGVKTHVTDWYEYEKSPAKKIADSWSVHDLSNIEEMKELVKREKIDGVLTGFTDSALLNYSRLCDELNLPNYGTTSQFEIFTDKREYKKLCDEYDIPVTKEYSINLDLDNIRELNYPILIKPNDGSGARGINICYDSNELINHVETAMSFSQTKDVLFEKYYEGTEITVFVLVKNSEIYLIDVADRVVQKVNKETIKLPVGYVFPSSHYHNYKTQIFPKFKQLLTSLNVENGLFFMQCIIDEANQIRLYDLGFRLTGSLEYKLFEEQYDFNPLSMLINNSITNNMGNDDIQQKLSNPQFKFSANISYLARPGKLESFKNIDKLLSIENVIDLRTTYDEGDEVLPESLGTLKQIITRVFIVSKTKEELSKTVEKCNELFDVLDQDGNSLLIGEFKI